MFFCIESLSLSLILKLNKYLQRIRNHVRLKTMSFKSSSAISKKRFNRGCCQPRAQVNIYLHQPTLYAPSIRSAHPYDSQTRETQRLGKKFRATIYSLTNVLPPKARKKMFYIKMGLNSVVKRDGITHNAYDRMCKQWQRCLEVYYVLPISFV